MAGSALRSRSLALGLAWLALRCSAPGPDFGALRRAEDLRELASPVLIEAASSPSAEMRERAALAMGRIQAPGYAGPLARLAGPGPTNVRLAALFALGQLGLGVGADPPPAEAVSICRSHLADPDPWIVAGAIEALGKLAPPGAASDLVPFLTNPEATLREQAALALFRLRFVPTWRGASPAPPPLAAEAVVALRRALGDDVDAVRRAAAHAFSRYGEPGAVVELVARLADTDEWTRLFAVRALGRSGERAARALLDTLDDPSPRVRVAALDALAALGARARVPIATSSDRDFQVRAAWCRAASHLDGAPSLAVLRSLSQDESPTVRAASIEALAVRLGDEYGADLRRHLDDPAWCIRAAAARALAHLGAARAESLARAASDPDARVRAAALEAAAGREGAEEAILAALADDDLAVRGIAVERLAAVEREDVTQLLQDVYRRSPGVAWIEVRESAVGAIDDPAARGFLEEVLRGDEAPSVRARARAALSGMGIDAPEPEAVPARPSPWLDVPLDLEPVVSLETSRGTLSIRLLSREAPLHVASFLERVREGFYDGLAWHRVVPGFVIQGGDPRGDGWGSAGYTLRDEIHPARFERGTVGMPKAGKDSGGCQIFITHVPTPHLEGNYTAFGRVVEGLDVIDRIEVGDLILRARVVSAAR